MTGGGTQAFPETGETGVPAADFAEDPTGVLPAKGDHRAARSRARDLLGTSNPKNPKDPKDSKNQKNQKNPKDRKSPTDLKGSKSAPGDPGPSGDFPGVPGDFPGAPRADRARDIPEPPGRTSVVRDPWGESGGTGQNHDPHEVTVQLDAVGAQGDRPVEGAPTGDAAGDGSEGPVFVDESGRRSRRYRRIGMVVGLACAVYAVVIVITLLSGNSNAPWLPMTGPKDDTPAGKVDTSPLPADPAGPAASAGAIPGITPTVSGGVTPKPGASGSASAAGASPAKPGASAAASATATRPGTDPSVSTGPSVTPTQQADPSVTPDPDPPASNTPQPSVTPSESAGGGSAGPGNVADGPASPAPIASETGTTAPAPAVPAAPSDAPLSPSPEHIL